MIQELVVYRRKDYIQKRKNALWYKFLFVFFLACAFLVTFTYPANRDMHYDAESKNVMETEYQSGEELSPDDKKHISKVKNRLFLYYALTPMLVLFSMMYIGFALWWHGDLADKEEANARVKFPDVIDKT
ncbi:hypothetical protein [Rappaport israeli]|uniref:hypothetical protein n=1 Tax=Rappaport israeli TaxID=1839807 RepID=UPI0013011C1A|nr:hypothetical protein [Rappaport israeli]